MRSRGNGRKLECCGEEVDKERRGKFGGGVFFLFFFFFFFFSKRDGDKWRQRCRAPTGVSVERERLCLQKCVP